MSFEREFGRALEGLSGRFGFSNPGRHKGSDGLAKMVVCEEVPVSIHIADVVGIYGALLQGRAGFAIGQAEGFAGGGRLR